MRVRLPIPATWQDFEAICHQLWKEIWADPNTQLNGRTGQTQNGVDIWGRPLYTAHYAGVQCKDRNGVLGSKLTKKELIAECSAAEKLKPGIHAFTMATTAARDTHIQEAARVLNANGMLPFKVHVWSWDDIEAEIACRPGLVDTFYRGAPKQTLDNAVKIAASAPRDQFIAFFNRPQLVAQLGTLVRDNLMQVAYELCDNALLHGKAKQVRLEFDGAVLSVIDDGVPFDPLSALDEAKASVSGHIGSLVFRSFLRRYASRIGVRYARLLDENGLESNLLSFQIADAAKSEHAPEVFDVSIDLSDIFGRRSAQSLAESILIPRGVKELVITVGNTMFPSGVFEFIRCLSERLPESISLTVSHPRGDMIQEFSYVLDLSKVRLMSR